MSERGREKNREMLEEEERDKERGVEGTKSGIGIEI